MVWKTFSRLIFFTLRNILCSTHLTSCDVKCRCILSQAAQHEHKVRMCKHLARCHSISPTWKMSQSRRGTYFRTPISPKPPTYIDVPTTRMVRQEATKIFATAQGPSSSCCSACAAAAAKLSNSPGCSLSARWALVGIQPMDHCALPLLSWGTNLQLECCFTGFASLTEEPAGGEGLIKV